MSDSRVSLDLPLPLPGGHAAWRGLPGPAVSLAVADAARRHAGLVLLVCAGEQQAYRLEEEVRFFAGPDLAVLHFPDTEVLPYDAFSPHQEILSARLAALERIPKMTRGVLVTTADALIQRLPPRAWLEGRTFQLRKGDRLDPAAFRVRLAGAGYAAVSEVQMQGEFAVRGSIVDLFPMGSEQAFRIDLFDDEIESIRTFDPETQRSAGTVDGIRLMPGREFPADKDGIETFRRSYRAYFAGDPSRSRIYSEVSRAAMPAGIESYLPLFFEATAGLLDYLPEGALLVEAEPLDAALAEDWRQIGERFERHQGDIERPLMKPADLFHTPEQVRQRLAPLARVAVAEAGAAEDAGVVLLGGGADKAQQLIKDAPGRILFIAESAGRREALLAWLKPQGITPRDHPHWPDFLATDKRYGILIGPLQQNLGLPQGVALLAETQIFGLTAPAQQRRRARVRDPEALLRNLDDLREGSPVVHVQHGVGRYRGLTRLDAGGVTAEYLVLEYANADKLYVPVASLALVHRYLGTDAEHAPLHTLGADRWDKARARARQRAHDVAAELLQVHARRAARPGMRLAVNDGDYGRFVAQFPFTPTPDQQKAIDDVLRDMAGDKPMDRVVCGDVGFGKTEVAMRACFAAVQNGRQVAVLVPTTLLAQQHFKNFSDRFAGWPVKIGALSRLRSDKEQNALLAEAGEGKVDIVIGTHRLLQDDVTFPKLGLVVIDEEHRFGVRHKERLKALRAEVDVLTLTATPIPRTLNMSLAGLRDLSIIATPPEGRLPIRTFVAEHERGLVYEACQRELRRGGQVYYLHNEVKDIERTARELRELVPEGQVRVAHGQMRERELEQVMLDFYHQRFSILVCTTIIESGIDVPTANTLIVDRADELGLAQLHQLRGRVGRSHHRAYAYLLVPSKRALKPDAAKRLDAIEAMGELGSGFLLATHDLEIRGAGELLGEEQSGQIEEVGFTLYAELLAEAVASIRAGRLGEPAAARDVEVDLGVTALLPDDYIPDVHTRLVLYKRLAECPDPDALGDFVSEMVDRFGSLPPPAVALADAARLRLRARRLGVAKVRAGGRGITLDFGLQTAIEPARLIRLIQSQPKVYRLEGQQRLHQQRALDAPDSRAPAVTDLFDSLEGTKREG
ncbi:MAG TPA: transcription-repair coupling factor [Candidatus Binatia bacterium]|nr:transcription-repair coupling factor [Candidatus Binatia bacterium]